MCLITGNLDQALNELRNADQLREVQVAGPGPLEYFNETCSAFLGPAPRTTKVYEGTVRVFIIGVQHVDVFAGGAAIQRLVREEQDLQPHSEASFFRYPVTGS